MKITILQEPIPKARARTVIHNGRVHSYTPKATQDAENAIRAMIATHKTYYDKGNPLALTATFYISRPPSTPKKRLYPVTRPDVDNYLKLVLDACNGYLWADDSQIIRTLARKEYGNPPRIELEITEVENA